ncbi:RagB/SusD family nutrient uptake outer membrane protein [Dyadobacter sp. CY323]|uniref:RagB/SusD family nutrient uptake outer membrane protein n=1 Tax=Dyadobacter sp. CY323 TaxID=2907302 RepID=UPI001F15B50E|nr:RagB/SusD family nutrient uptake outer membrane protein [Dyadobacter sp. CY323]MCE6987555.1 RagB/SusD family nutrient uptake outer membrane protein [Dyadobacter sp. CY323]
MKKILYIFLGIFTFTSCTDLNENPASLITTEQFYKTESDALAAVTSVYNAALNNGGLTMYNRLVHLAFEIMSDDAIAGLRVTNADVRSISVLSHSTTNDRVDELWRESYVAINRANIAIERIPQIEMDATLRTRLVNESKFLRALLYFNLVRLWGDVPLVLQEVNSLGKDAIQVGRTPKEAVYQQIIKDLTDAEALPKSFAGADAGRATGGAAKSILAKVYLTRQEWDKAAAKSLEVINGGYGYDLFENFADVFNVATKNGKEHIFSVQCKSNVNGQGNRLASSATPVGIPGVAAAGTDEPHADVYKLYAATDKRRDVTFFTSLVSPTTGKEITFPPRFFKYFDMAQIGNPTESAKNIPVIRYAEILLIYAEAINESTGPTTEAYASINKVRNRAGLAPLAGLTKDTFREAVYLERRLELMFEFQRWFDLVRTKRMITDLHKAGKTNAAEKHYLHPIPQRELDLNPKLVQNPGWE